MSVSKIRKEARSLNNSFQIVERRAWDEIYAADGRGDTVTADELFERLEAARSKKEQALTRLRRQLQSGEVADSLVKNLDAQAKDARKYLEAIKETASTLKTLEHLAKIASKIITLLT